MVGKYEKQEEREEDGERKREEGEGKEGEPSGRPASSLVRCIPGIVPSACLQS